MKKSKIHLFVLAFSLLSLLPLHPWIYAQSTTDITGTWDFTVSAAEGERQVVVTLTKNGETLSGLLNMQRGDVPLQNLSVQGEAISFILKLTIQDQESTFAFKGAVQGSSMKGDAELGPYGKGTWTANRRPNLASASSTESPISGTWKFDFETPNGLQSGDLTLRTEGNQLAGTGKSSLGEFPVTGSLQEKEIVLAFQVNYQGEPMKIQCKGKLENEGSMTGTFTYNDMGPSSWTARKKS